LRAPAARAAAAELSAKLAINFASEAHVLTICRDPLEIAEAQSTDVDAVARSRRLSLETKNRANSDEVHSMINSQGQLSSVRYLPDPRHALRELRTADVPVERVAQVLEEQAFALSQLSQLLPILDLRAILAHPANVDGTGTQQYQKPSSVPITLGCVRSTMTRTLLNELRDVIDAVDALLPGASTQGMRMDACMLPMPLQLLTSNTHKMLLQLQIALYRTYRRLLLPSTSTTASQDAACLLRVLHHMRCASRFPDIQCDAQYSLDQRMVRALEPDNDCVPSEMQWLCGWPTSKHIDHGCIDFDICQIVGGTLSQMHHLLGSNTRRQRLTRALSHAGTTMLSLSDEGMKQLRSEHALLGIKHAEEVNLRPSHQLPLYEASVPHFDGLLENADRAPAHSVESTGLGELRRWIFNDSWDSSTEPPAAMHALVDNAGGSQVEQNLLDFPDQKMFAQSENIAPADRDEACVKSLRVELANLRQHALLERTFLARCPQFSYKEFIALYERCVEIQLAPSSHESPLEATRKQFQRTQAWSVREDRLRRSVEKNNELEQTAGAATLVAAHRLRTQSKIMLQPRDTAVRNCFAFGEEEEQTRAHMENRLVARSVAMSAVHPVLKRAAHGPCVSMSDPQCPVHHALAARLVRVLAPANTCLACEDASDANNTPCGRSTWTLQLHLQVLSTLGRYDSEAWQAGKYSDEPRVVGEGANWDVEVEQDDDNHDDKGELSQAEVELLQLVQAAYDGRSTLAGPETTLMRAAVLKAMIAVGAQSTLDGAAIGRPELPASVGRFDTLSREPEPHMRLQKFISFTALQRLRSKDSSSTLASQCCKLRHLWADSHLLVGQQRMLGLLVHCKASASSLSQHGRIDSAVVAVGASDFKITLIHRLAKLDKQMESALVEDRVAAKRVEAHVRQDFEAEVDCSGVQRLLLKGRLREEQLKLKGVVQHSCFETKREAMMKMVQSGALPIGLKQGSLSAVREEEALVEIEDELLQLRLLLWRIKTTSRLHLLKRKRAHQIQLREAEHQQSRDLPVIEEMGSSKQRHKVLKHKLLETQRMLARFHKELEMFEKRRAQLHRAMGNLRFSGVPVMQDV